MKYILLLFIICFGGQIVYGQEKACRKNPDLLYDRHDVLIKLSKSLEKSVVGFPKEFLVVKQRAIRFFVFDLTNPSNNSVDETGCVDFIEGHVYHFSPVYYDHSQSSIAILQAGEIKIFERTNCGDIDGNLNKILSYLNNNSNKIIDYENTFKRTANYRRYGFWIDLINQRLLNCKITSQIPPNPEKSYYRYSVLDEMLEELYKYLPKSFKNQLFIKYIENERAVGFYIQDLVDLDNKQTNLLERVDFKEGHLYQFGWIDAPYSISHFVVLKNGKIHFFQAIDCKPKELKKLVSFINENFEDGKVKRDLLERVNNYKKYRVAIKFDNRTEPKCN